MITALFWISLSLLLYTNGGYLLILWLMARMHSGKCFTSGGFAPQATILITAFNEEDCIAETIQSILGSEYPEDKLKITIVSDCSTDRTDTIVSKFDARRVRLVRMPARGGKLAAQELGLSHMDSEIVIIADASGIFLPDTVKTLINHFEDPRVGLVVGRKRIRATGTVVADGEGIYWKYDAFLRSLESRTGSSCVGAEGGLTAIRRRLFPTQIPADIAEDYAMGCELLKQGYQSRYDPAAVVYETSSDGIEAEFRRKVRVIVKGMRTFFHYRSLLNPLRGWSYPFQTVSHKLLRWAGPFLLIALLVSSGLSNGTFQRIAFYAQVSFYALAVVGYLSRSVRSKLTSVPLYLVTVNLAALVAWGLIFKKYGIWEPTRREHPVWSSARGALIKERT